MKLHNGIDIKQSSIIFSNRIEMLQQSLMEHLFASGTTPFTKRLVIVPSNAVAEYIRRSFATDPTLNIFCGIDLVLLDRGISKVVDFCFDATNSLPSQMELTLALNQKVEMLEHLDATKSMRLAIKLASLFRGYSLYGGEKIQEWMQEPQGWQQTLFKDLFGPDGPFVDHQSYFSGLRAKKEIPDFQVHLFGFNHLATVVADFFVQTANLVPLMIYQPSFCQHYWGDILSNREHHFVIQKLKKEGTPLEQIESFEGFTDKGHPLLANCGVLARKFDALLQESSMPIVENYLPTDPQSSLQTLQADILDLHESAPLPADGTIEVHVATSAYREVEILKNNLIDLMANHQILPHEIRVMAPDIDQYAPYIEVLFKDLCPFTITDLSTDLSGSDLEGLLLFLSLESKRFSSKALLELFWHPLFKQKHGFSKEDLQAIEEWIQKTNICWGYDLDHRNRLLVHNDSDCQEEGGSWESGLRRLVELISQTDDLVAISQLELLGQWIEQIRALYADLTFFWTASPRSIKQWCEKLEDFTSRNFAPLEGSVAKVLSKMRSENSCPLAFSKFYALLEQQIETLRVGKHVNLWNQMTFCNLASASLVPAKIIALLGISESTFPRKMQTERLDLLQEGDLKEYIPSKGDFDRNFFLEASCSARTHFLVSYFEEPSALVLELCDHLDPACTLVHPMRSFDPLYFEEMGARSFSEIDFQMATAITETKKVLAWPQIVQEKVAELTIDIKDLNGFARSAYRHYFQKGAGLYFYSADQVQEEEAFTLTPLRLAQMRRALGDQSIDQMISKCKADGHFPMHHLGQVAMQVATRELREHQKTFEEHGLDLAAAVTVELTPHVQSPTWFNATHLLCPQLELELESGQKVAIVGSLDSLYPEGLVVYDKANFAGCARIWPQFLIANLVGPGEGLCSSAALFFAKQRGQKEFSFSNQGQVEDHLRNYLALYLEAIKVPLPLLPTLIEPIAQENVVRVEREFSSLLDRGYDDALRFAYRTIALPSASQLVDQGAVAAKALYKGITDGWV